MNTNHAPLELRFVGCGDAFGSGGRFNTCFHVSGAGANFLIDCGATSLVALKRSAITPNSVRSILITHFHADHFGGLPFFLLDAQFVSKRREPLVIAGPTGLSHRLDAAMEAFFPGASDTAPSFELSLVELEDGARTELEGIGRVTPHGVKHGTIGGPFFGYRVECGAKVIAYTGDTEWTESIVDIGRDADLLVAEAYARDTQVPMHLDLATLEGHLPEIGAKRLILTHMSEEMLDARDTVAHECAEDGLRVRI